MFADEITPGAPARENNTMVDNAKYASTVETNKIPEPTLAGRDVSTDKSNTTTGDVPQYEMFLHASWMKKRILSSAKRKMT